MPLHCNTPFSSILLVSCFRFLPLRLTLRLDLSSLVILPDCVYIEMKSKKKRSRIGGITPQLPIPPLPTPPPIFMSTGMDGP